MSAVLVTGATGTVGRAVVAALHERGEPVVAAVQDATAQPSLPVDVAVRSFAFSASPAANIAALADCDRLFLLRPPAISDVQTHLFPLIDAAMAVGVRQIVFLSLQGVQHNRSTPHHAVEQYAKAIGAPFTFLRPNFFMQNLSTTYREDIRDRDKIFLPAGRAFTAFIDAQDIGRVAAVTLTEAGHLGRAYTLSGEQTLSYRQVAAVLSDTLGRQIRYARPSEGEYLAELRRRGAPDDYVDVQRMIYRIVRLNVSALPNRAVRRLTGAPATTFHEFAEREKAVWQRG